MHFAEPANRRRITEDSRRTSGAQTTQRPRLETKHVGVSSEREQLHQIALHIVEVQWLTCTAPLLGPSPTGGNAGERFYLSQVRTLHGKLFADFEQAHARLLPAQI